MHLRREAQQSVQQSASCATNYATHVTALHCFAELHSHLQCQTRPTMRTVLRSNGENANEHTPPCLQCLQPQPTTKLERTRVSSKSTVAPSRKLYETSSVTSVTPDTVKDLPNRKHGNGSHGASRDDTADTCSLTQILSTSERGFSYGSLNFAESIQC